MYHTRNTVNRKFLFYHEDMAGTGPDHIKLEAELRKVRGLADSVGAPVWLVAIPAPVQVCGAEELEYFPRFLNLQDESLYDLEQLPRLAL